MALKMYHRALKRVEGMLGKNTTTDATELNRAGKALFGKAFRGVFASDDLPPLGDGVPYALVNTDKKGMPGTHWLAVAKYPGDPGLYVYDSFGRDTDDLVPWLGRGPFIDPEYDAEQRVEETNCGQRCLAWLEVFDQLGPEAALEI